MALTSKPAGRWWSRFHFLLRLAGLTGLLVAGVGLALVVIDQVEWWRAAREAGRGPWEAVRPVLAGESGEPVLRTSLWLVIAGSGAVVLAVLAELVSGLRLAAGRRSAFGLNAALQVVLAVVIVVGVNVFSFGHYQRLDWTWNHQFTLAAHVPERLLDQLRELKDETTIVVYQQHKTFSQLSDKPDAYDYAAERKVVEKVQDLVDQFRELGPQFRVVVLDVEEEGYNARLEALTAGAPELKEAIASAPENSIFFQAGHRVQRLSFNEFYQLDKTASRDADGGRGNLVLLNQGVEPFVRKVLNIEEKRPKVGILSIHEWLTSQGPEEFGLGGLKKALGAHGIDVRDVILKKWSETGASGPEAAVYTYEESRLEQLEEQLGELDAEIKGLEGELADLGKVLKLWRTASLEELSKQYAKELGGRKLSEPVRQRQVAYFQLEEQVRRAYLAQDREDRDAAAREKTGFNVDSAGEQRRIADLKAKLDRSLADCDLLLIPRMTIRNVLLGDRIPYFLYRLDDAQVAAVKDFIRAGKPVFVCFGPANEHPSDRMRMAQMAPEGPDELEMALKRLGIRFGKQTVLFNVESKAFAERRTGLFSAGAGVEVPPVEFEGGAQAAALPLRREPDNRPPNPVARAMRIIAHSLGRKNLDLRVRYPRPIYFEPPDGEKLDYQPDFLVTSAASWNEEQPFPTRERAPRFEPPKPDDPDQATLDVKRRGPFPIGVAVETRVPADWYSGTNAKAATVRVAAVGSGGIFVGGELSPAKEELLVNTCNWLLGRQELLPHADEPWSYPRVAMDAREQNLWRWGAWVGLPGIFAYLGLVVFMVRRLR